MSLDLSLLLAAAVTLVAIGAARLSARVGLPALLLFLGVGMLLGDSGLGISFSDPQLAAKLGFAALVIILAEGGLTTKWSEIRPAVGVAMLLATASVGVSVAVVALFAHYVFGLTPAVAVVLGGIVASTDAAAVFAVLRNVAIPGRLRATLEAESGLNDAPTVLIVTMATSVALHRAPEGGTWVAVGLVVIELLAGQALGLGVGLVAAWLMRRVQLPSSGLYAIAAVAWAFGVYELAGVLHVSGFAAAYVASVVLGNSQLPHRQSVRAFAEGLGWIAQIGLFVMLGLLASPSRITWGVVGAGLVLGLFLLLVARPLSVVLVAAGFRLPWREQAFMSWAGLRGAVPIILCTIPMAARLPGAERLFDMVLVLVIAFTFLQGPTLPWLGQRLGLVDPHGPRDVDIEAAPLDRLRAELLQVRVPDGSKLAGVSVRELRLPKDTVVSLIIRDETPFAPTGRDRLEVGDEMMIMTPTQHRAKVEVRLTEIGRGGRLARWNGVRAD
ncbi:MULTISPECIES: potassium/proton antiporter [Aestuariimicrobium]|uniref:potassium/proton antiporter n=1 Tax=Aestuariimicrobium TaxID=396388 RepID=UPI0003B491A3|nr:MULTISPECIES: potassium/proton antiporter [Aestuariimicrobium]CAI9402161.1 K(+)/H(+) antiporter NhaP2 [Aestuariimicrobium sp. T2.26MG-19.2B]